MSDSNLTAEKLTKLGDLFRKPNLSVPPFMFAFAEHDRPVVISRPPQHGTRFVDMIYSGAVVIPRSFVMTCDGGGSDSADALAMAVEIATRLQGEQERDILKMLTARRAVADSTAPISDESIRSAVEFVRAKPVAILAGLARTYLVPSEHMVEQWRFPRTKKRRIRNKWARRPENLRPIREVFMIGGYAVAHPETIARLKG